MVTLAQLLCAALLPCVLSVILAAVTRDFQRISSPVVQRGFSGLLLAVVVLIALVACAMAVDAPVLFPRAGWFWLPWAVLGLLPGLAFAVPPGWWRWAVQVVIASAGGALLLFPVSHSLHDMLSSACWIAGAVGCVCGSFLATQKLPGSPLVERLGACLVGLCVVVGAGLSGSLNFSLLALIIPAAIAGQAVVVRNTSWAGGNLATAHLVAWTLLVNVHYSEMPWFGAVPLALALPLGALATVFASTERSRVAWRLGLTAALGALAIALIVACGQPTGTASDGPSYQY